MPLWQYSRLLPVPDTVPVFPAGSYRHYIAPRLYIDIIDTIVAIIINIIDIIDNIIFGTSETSISK